MIVALALVLAIVAGGISYLYLHDAQQRAYGNAKLTTVYELTGSIPSGTSGATLVSSGLVKQAKIPTEFRPSDAVSDVAAIRGEVTVANLSAGQILTSGLFVSPLASAGTVAAAIPRGDVAITVSVDSVHGVAGFIQPNDHVDVMVEIAGNEQFLYQNVRVLAVGSSVATTQPGTTTAGASSSSGGSPSSSSPSSNSGLITFAVPPDAAQRIALAQSGGGGVSGSLYLALVPPGNVANPVAPVSAADLIPATPSPG